MIRGRGAISNSASSHSASSPLVLLLSPLLASCGFVVDFVPSDREGGVATSTDAVSASASSSSGEVSTGGAGGPGDGGGGSGGGTEQGGGGSVDPCAIDPEAPPIFPAVLTFRSRGKHGRVQPDEARVQLDDLAFDGDVTWVGGWFAGAELVLVSGAGDEEVLLVGSEVDEEPAEVTTFILAVDAEGGVTAFPIAALNIGETAEATLGVHVEVADDGDVVVLSSVRDGAVLLEGVDAERTWSWDVVVARIPADGDAPRWAQRCAVTSDDDDVAGSALSGSLAGLARSGDQVLMGVTVLEGTQLGCVSIDSTGEGGCDDVQLPASPVGAVFPLDLATGACTRAGTLVDAGAGTFLDDLDATSEGVRVTGRVAFAGGITTLEPWGADVGPADGVAFSAVLTSAAEPREEDVEWRASSLDRAAGAVDGTFASATPTDDGEGPPHVQIARPDGSTWTFGATDDGPIFDVPTDVAVLCGAALISGFFAEDATPKMLCGEDCRGDLEADDSCTGSEAGAVAQGDDAFWMLVPDDEEQPTLALGRGFGGCGRQRIVAGSLDKRAVTLLATVEGDATIDLLDEARHAVSSGDSRRAGVFVRIPRPDLDP